MLTLLQRHTKKYFPCSECSLHKTKFKHVVYRGSLPADVLFVGEAPGHTEDELGIPFIGRAGDILSHLVHDSRSKLYPHTYSYGITNVICCLPVNPDDVYHFRMPKQDEIEACRPRLLDIASKCNPKLIVLLGKVAEKGFPTQDIDAPCISIQHPAYILRKGGVTSVDYKRNLLDLLEGLTNYVKKANKQHKKKIKQRSTKKPTKRISDKKQVKTIKKRSR